MDEESIKRAASILADGDHKRFDDLVTFLRETKTLATFDILLVFKTTALFSEMFIRKFKEEEKLLYEICKELNFDDGFEEDNDKLLSCLKKVAITFLDSIKEFDKAFAKKPIKEEKDK